MMASHPEYRRLVEYMKRGGAVLREDVGGVVGVRWTTAHLSVVRFDPKACERLMERGCKVGGKLHALSRERDVSSEVYRLLCAE